MEEREHCTVCGGGVCAQEDVLRRGERRICSLCMENLSVSGLLALTDCRNVRSFLCVELGFDAR